MNLLPFISLVSLTPSSLGFLSQWSERSELGEWRDVTSPLHMMKGMRKDINNNNKIYKIFFQLLLLLFMSFPTHSLLSHLATLTGRRERVWRRNRETDGTVKWDEREGIVRIGLRLHHSFCLSESNPYNPFSFHSSPWAPLVMLPRFSRGAYHHFLFIEWGGTGAGGNSGTEWDGNGSEVSVRTRSFCKWYVFYFHSPLGTEIPLRNTNRKHVNENSPLPVSPVEPARLTPSPLSIGWRMKWTRKCIWNSFIGCWLPIHSLSCDRIFFTRFGLQFPSLVSRTTGRRAACE